MNHKTYHVNLANEKQYVVHQYPNQKVVQIHKLCENGHTNPNMKAQEKAINDLSDSAFKLYCYIVWKPHMGLWALSKEAINQSEHVFRKSVNELISKSYLVAGVLHSGAEVVEANGYHFYELPCKNDKTVAQKEIVVKNEKPMFIKRGAVDRQIKVNTEIIF